MWTSRYWPTRYWARRYWPEVLIAPPVPPDEITEATPVTFAQPVIRFDPRPIKDPRMRRVFSLLGPELSGVIGDIHTDVTSVGRWVRRTFRGGEFSAAAMTKTIGWFALSPGQAVTASVIAIRTPTAPWNGLTSAFVTLGVPNRADQSLELAASLTRVSTIMGSRTIEGNDGCVDYTIGTMVEPGDPIRIVGAGDAGADLEAVVTEIIDDDTITIDREVSTSVVGTDMYYPRHVNFNSYSTAAPTALAWGDNSIVTVALDADVDTQDVAADWCEVDISVLVTSPLATPLQVRS